MIFNCHAGHNQYVHGADDYLVEHEEVRKVKSEVIRILRACAHTAYDTTDELGHTKTKILENVVYNCKKHSVDYGLSFHMNACAHDTTEGGVEVCIYSDSNTTVVNLAAKISANIAKKLGIVDRGVKIRPELYVIKNVPETVFLVECCFVDEQEDYLAYKKYGYKAIAVAVLEAFDIREELYNNEKPSSWAEESWNRMIEKGITDGSRPHDFCTREEVVAMIDRAMK